MNVNERIARGLGRTNLMETHPDGAPWQYPWHLDGQPNRTLPDYEHSLDALLEPLGVLRERRWYTRLTYGDFIEVEIYYMDLNGSEYDHIRKEADTLPEALALAVAEALEASK